MSSMKRPDGQKRFPKLSTIAFLVLTIPYSNAEEERVFSIIRQNRTSFRPNLYEQETRGSIMTIKTEISNQPTPKGGIFNFPPCSATQKKSDQKIQQSPCKQLSNEIDFTCALSLYILVLTLLLNRTYSC